MTLKIKLFALLITAILIGAACIKAPREAANTTAGGNNSVAAKDPNRKIKIGFSMDTVQEERWQRDKALFEKRCQELNIECFVTVADEKADKQANDVDNLLTKGIDVLVIAPNNATQAATMVAKAKAQGVPVVSYDRLVKSDEIDIYVAHHPPLIGKKIAEYALAKVPKGNYIMVYGDSNDNNAVIWQQVEKEVLQPAIDRGDVKIVAEQNAKGWQPEEALKIVENALTQSNNTVVAVVASNDGTAGGAIQALAAQGLTGKVIVTGQDAELPAMQHIAEGKQSMTIYKPIQPLVVAAIDAALKLARGETVAANDKILAVNREVPAVYIDIQVIEKSNLMDVIKDGYHRYEDVFKNIPETERPPKP